MELADCLWKWAAVNYELRVLSQSHVLVPREEYDAWCIYNDGCPRPTETVYEMKRIKCNELEKEVSRLLAENEPDAYLVMHGKIEGMTLVRAKMVAEETCGKVIAIKRLRGE